MTALIQSVIYKNKELCYQITVQNNAALTRLEIKKTLELQ